MRENISTVFTTLHMCIILKLIPLVLLWLRKSGTASASNGDFPFIKKTELLVHC